MLSLHIETFRLLISLYIYIYYIYIYIYNTLKSEKTLNLIPWQTITMTTVMASIQFGNFSYVNKTSSANDKIGKQHNQHLGSQLVKLQKKFKTLPVEMMR